VVTKYSIQWLRGRIEDDDTKHLTYTWLSSKRRKVNRGKMLQGTLNMYFKRVATKHLMNQLNTEVCAAMGRTEDDGCQNLWRIS
jgi:hypothetical protein